MDKLQGLGIKIYKKMRKLKNMLVVGGASRNVGKTELVCGLVRRLGAGREIISLKISGINAGNDPHHGNHEDKPEKFHLLEETNLDGVKDSSKMLLAGASRSFYLRCKDEYLQEAVYEFLSGVDKDAVIICESISVRKVIEPGLFILIRGEKMESMKKVLGEVMHLVDLTIVSDGKTFDPDPGVIRLDSRGWYHALS